MSKKIKDLTVDEFKELMTSIMEANKPKVVDLNIDTLIENANLFSTKMRENMAESKRIITETLLEAIKDVEIVNENVTDDEFRGLIIKYLSNPYLTHQGYMDSLMKLKEIDPVKYEKFIKGYF